MLSLGGSCPQKERAGAEGCSLGGYIPPPQFTPGSGRLFFCPTPTRVAGKVREKLISGMMLVPVFFSAGSPCTRTKRISQ